MMFNQEHHTHIKPNKTWRLLYLQPKMLDALKKSASLIYDSEAYASHFSTQRRAIQIDVARIKAGLVTDRLPAVRTVADQLVKDKPILQRLEWEERFKNFCNTESLWKQSLKKAESASVKYQLEQLYSQWHTHHAFQRHSSRGLLFLLDGISYYKQHFIRAIQELRNTQRKRFTFQRLPDFVAEPYFNFLDQQLNELELLQPKVLETLLLRLKTAEYYKQVSCDDVSYVLAERMKNLNEGFPVSLPTVRQTHLDAATFNQFQRAIERYGNENQKQQLYRLVWYQRAKTDPICGITTIKMGRHHLLIPKALINFLPTLKKSTWLFPNQADYLPFLETQQALFAQLALPILPIKLPLEKVSLTHPQLQSSITRYQLLQRALAHPLSVHWWERQKKQYKKHCQHWLEHQLQKAQADVWTWLSSLQHCLYYRTELLDQSIYRQRLQTSVAHFQCLADNDSPAYRSAALMSMFESLSVLFKEKETQSIDQIHRATELIQRFKHDLGIALENCLQRCTSQALTFSANHVLELYNLQQFLKETNDVIQIRELFIQRYQAIPRFQFIKLFAASPHKTFQHELQTVLENPNYSIEELKRAADTLASVQRNIVLNDSASTSTMEKQKTQLSVQIAYDAYYFFKLAEPNKPMDFFTKCKFYTNRLFFSI